ncbi:MAG: UDP-N-acetylglucosamine 1-carboxyvinyltransferase [Armatimonadetes bacterium Cent15-Ar3]|nr:MAG: UDP-N-acetylglucosamine 1-carboxyvinyltransferase [Armatimonadetes bacterium Cent15-Ar3]
MDALLIKGGKRLSGVIEVAGSKNIALAVLSAVPLAQTPVLIRNVPVISDTQIKVQLLESFGAKAEWHGSDLRIDCSKLHSAEPDEDMVRLIRTSFYMLGPLVARVGSLRMAAPGGCKIGARPVDLHLKGLHALGAKVELDGGVYEASAGVLRGSEVYLDMPSAGATQHIMCAASMAKGVTTIQNAAMEPEIVALAEFLTSLGAKISGQGSSLITIEGVEQLGGSEYKIPADRIQAGTFLIAGAMTGGNVTVKEINADDQTAVVNKLREAGAEVETTETSVTVNAPNRLNGVNIKTMPHPGFPTDVQQPMAAALCVANGASVVEETIYESRTGHLPELSRMGANIRQEGRSAFIVGVDKLRGAKVQATDLRAGAALCLAGLVAEGETLVQNIHWIDRGYDSIERKLTELGADASRVQDS